MEKIKKYLKPTIIWTILILIYFSIMLIIGYTGVFKLKTISITNTVITACLLFFLGIKMGKKTSKKGFLEGLKLGGITTICLLLLNVIFYRNFNLFIFLYYLVLIASPTIGGIVGINLKH